MSYSFPFDVKGFMQFPINEAKGSQPASQVERGAMAKNLLPKILIVLIFMGLFHLLPWRACAEVPLYQENPLGGSRVFFQKGCAKCHSILNVGGKIGPDLGKVELNYSFFGIAAIMWNHAPKMLVKFTELDITFPELYPGEMAALISFLSYLNYLERSSNPDRGRELFEEKRCIKCHSVGRIGGDVGPELDKFRPYQSPIFITTAFWNKAPKMAEKMLELGVERPEFSGGEIVDIMTFIREEAIATDDKRRRIYAPPGNPRAGEVLFREKRCIHCHTIQGEGGEIGPNLGDPDLRKSFTGLAERLWNHGPKMWEAMKKEGVSIPEFSETEMSDVLSYIYYGALQEREGDPESGKRLIGEKGCDNCHPIRGKGGDPDLAPDLAEKSSKVGLDSPLKVITELWNHIQSMGKRVEEKGMTWPTFESHEMADITSYIVRLATP